MTTMMLIAMSSTANGKDMNNVLTAKQQSLVAISAFEAKGDIESLTPALTTALKGNLTVNEAKEALSHLYAYTGFPRSLNALGSLQGVVAKLESENVKLEYGKEATAIPADFDALAEGTKVQTKLCGGKPFDYEFVPATDYYLKAHLFGDIFARDVLSESEREMVTVSALSVMEGVESQLTSHVRGAINMGVSRDQLDAIALVLKEKVGETEAYRLRKAIAKHFGETFTEVRPLDNPAFPKGEPNTAYAKYFVGNSYLAPLTTEGLGMSNVTFEPGCRNNWHIHHKGRQILICVAGEGWYQEWGKPAQKLHEGDVVNIDPEVKHWHGATADSWFQHIAIGVPSEGASNEWLEPVSDEEYNKLK